LRKTTKGYIEHPNNKQRQQSQAQKVIDDSASEERRISGVSNAHVSYRQ
jgi:hypothetical protein